MLSNDQCRGLHVVHNRGHGYSNSSLPCRGVHLHTHVITYRLILFTLQAGSGRGRTPRHYPHVTFSNLGVDYLSLTPLESPAGSMKRNQIMQGTKMPPLSDGFTASQVHPHIYMMHPSFFLFLCI